MTTEQSVEALQYCSTDGSCDGHLAEVYLRIFGHFCDSILKQENINHKEKIRSMKCSECAEYKDCSRKYDLRIRRKLCRKTDTAKYVVMEEGGGLTKDEITTPLPEAPKEG